MFSIRGRLFKVDGKSTVIENWEVGDGDGEKALKEADDV